MKNDLLFADAELRAISVQNDDVFRMANARAAIGRVLSRLDEAEQKAKEEDPGKDQNQKKEKKTEDVKK